MAQARHDGWANPKRMPSCIAYDLTRGTPHSHAGAPLKFEVRCDGDAPAEKKWTFVKQGGAGCSVPCARLDGSCYALLHPPMRRNGGGQFLNQYTLTMQVRFCRGKGDDDDTPIFGRGLLSTGGWDDASPQVMISP